MKNKANGDFKNRKLTTGKNNADNSERMFLSLFENLPVGVFQTSPEGKILTANPTLLSMLGFDSYDEFLNNVDVGRDLYVCPDERRILTYKLEQEGKIQNVELKLRKKDGTHIVVLENSNVVRDENGKVLYYQGILTDITDRRRMEEELVKHREHLEELVNERTCHLARVISQLQAEITERTRAEEKLKKLTEELRQSNEELEQFAYVASHDLQEPLRMISSYTQLLMRRYKGKLDQDADEFINFAVDGAKRMQALINDLLAYSRVSRREMNLEPVDCEMVLKKVLTMLEPCIKERKVKIINDTLPRVMADSLKLEQVFQNIISNAIKFCDKEFPEIHISAKHSEREWIFSVSDNGIGISRQYFERIFLIFQRLHTQAEYPGTGIGLAICKKIIEKFAGRIWVESEVGKGSKFFFSIPEKVD